MSRAGALTTFDDVLRRPGDLRVATLAGVIVVAGFCYGAMAGTFGLRALQILYSGLKIPLLLFATSVVVVPSFFVINTILGLRDDFAEAMKGIVAAQAVLALTLLACAPFMLLIYASSDDYSLAILVNGALFAVATATAQVVLSRHYRPLVRARPRHVIAKRLWVILYVFVGIQSAWMLRPFIGAPSLETTFFRAEAWTNAYIAIADTFADFFRNL